MASTATLSSLASDRPQDRAIAVWLLVCCAMIFAMAVIGAITRLTESGLSIMEWAPLSGALPPLSEAEWQRLFALYKTIPEYQQINRGMSVDEFKQIYWWEWGHRLLGRLIGVAFFIPFVWFWVTRRVERPLVPKLLTMFVLGGLQGALGWYMVMSGLSERVDVSQYRLAAHLGLACVIYGYILWVAFDLTVKQQVENTKPENATLKTGAMALLALVYLQIVLGAFVAGLDAGLIYNTWPLMDGDLVPAGLFSQSPWWRNPFENLLSVQFNHRLIAYALAAFAVWHWLRARHSALAPSAAIVLITVFAQIALGIWTLLAVVPISLGIAHQAGAMVVLTTALYHAHQAARSPAPARSA